MTNHSALSDETLVAYTVGGDTTAYAEIMARYEPRLQRYSQYLLRDDAAARDVVQDTFIKAYQNLRSFNQNFVFSSWIYRIAHNLAMNAIKKERHTSTSDIELLPDTRYEAGLEEIVDTTLLRHGVHACLRKLSPKYRDVIQLVYFENMKYEQVSDVLHIPVSTVGVRLRRAKVRLLAICKQLGVK